jgi:hypothetical protein
MKNVCMKNTSSSLTAFSAADLIKIFERDLFYTRLGKIKNFC